MDKNNLPGLTPLWLILLATAFAVFIPITIPFLFGSDIKASDWFGLTGSVLTACVAWIAIYYAWRGISQQVRVSLMSREEDRMERELPGLKELAVLLARANILALMNPRAKSAIRVLESLRLYNVEDEKDKTILQHLEAKTTRAIDADRRALAAIFDKIAISADILITLETSLNAPLSEDEGKLLVNQMEDLKNGITEFSSFKLIIDDRIEIYERRLPLFKAELSRFFEGI
jgi:hypothetical protein